jgi:hypothetical protein
MASAHRTVLLIQADGYAWLLQEKDQGAHQQRNVLRIHPLSYDQVLSIKCRISS